MSNFTPGTSVTISAPPIVINGVNAQTGAVVGTASMGPVNQAVLVTGNSFESIFGAPQVRKYDGGTVVAEAALNSTAPLYFVRVTDTNDTAATATVTNGASISGLTTGTGLAGTTVSFATAGKANAITMTVTLGNTSESFINISASNASVFWAAANAAVNTGAGVTRGPSNLVRFSIANATTLPTLPSSVTLTGGNDGVAGVGANSLVGAASSGAGGASGMYALTTLPAQYCVLADCDTTSTYTTQAAFGQQEFMLMGCVLPAGMATQTANAVLDKQSAGLDSFEAVLLQGDWITYSDPTFGLRKVSPQGYWLGTRSSLLPHESVLNKPILGIVGSERSASTGPYSLAETNTLASAGIEVIANPIPAGAAWGCLTGRNTSSVVGAQSDAYSTLTNFLAQTFENAGGPYIGAVNNSQTQAQVTASFNHFLNGLVSQGILALNADGSAPYIVTCSSVNNSQTSEALGNLNVGVQVTYQAIIWNFNVDLTGGPAVVTMTSTINA